MCGDFHSGILLDMSWRRALHVTVMFSAACCNFCGVEAQECDLCLLVMCKLECSGWAHTDNRTSMYQLLELVSSMVACPVLTWNPQSSQAPAACMLLRDTGWDRWPSSSNVCEKSLSMREPGGIFCIDVDHNLM